MRKHIYAISQLLQLFNNSQNTTGNKERRFFVGKLYATSKYLVLACSKEPKGGPDREIFKVRFTQTGKNFNYVYPSVYLPTNSRLHKIVENSGFKDSTIFIHRLILILSGNLTNKEKGHVHHININPFDARYENLCIVDKTLHSEFHKMVDRGAALPAPSKEFFLQIRYLSDCPKNTRHYKRVSEIAVSNYKWGKRGIRQGRMLVILTVLESLGSFDVPFWKLKNDHRIAGKIRLTTLKTILNTLIQGGLIIKSKRGFYSLQEACP